jgi:hypothetical protein
MIVTDEVVAPLARLARALVGNHIRLSVPPDLQEEACRTLVKDSVSCSMNRAVIVVVGAGASLDAVGLPAARDTAVAVRQRLKVPDKYYDGELSRLTRQFRLDPAEFETQMLALGKFEPNELRATLVDIFGRRFYMAQCYEILAHLLKHRFVDAVVNFNFDEILDQAIADEVGHGNYWRIISDGDLPGGGIWGNDARIRRPLYIKPHGTFSHESSLRFTRESYLLIPESITELVGECLTKTPVTIVTVGFRMRSVEFQGVVQKAVESGRADIEVIAIDPLADVLEGFAGIPKERLHRHDPRPLGLAKTFEELWKEVGLCFAKSGFARGIQRHQLLAQLFQDRPHIAQREADRGKDLTYYLRDRALVELALAVAKAKGFVHVGQLAESRAGHYLRQYRDGTPGSERTLYKLCRTLSLYPVGYSHDTMRLLPPSHEREGPQELIVGRDQWPDARQQLVDAVSRGLKQDSRQQNWAKSATGQKMLESVFDAMYDGDEVEVISSRNSHRTLLFEAPEELPSFVTTRIYTTGLLKRDWDLLLCVAESGEWLTKVEVVDAAAERRNRAIAVIVADQAYKSEIEDIYNARGVKIWVMPLPWWLHNQHMTLAVKKGRPTRALFFERRLRSLAINPVGLDGDADLKAVQQTFYAYWAKAKQHVTGGAFVRPEDVSAAQSELFDVAKWPSTWP